LKFKIHQASVPNLFPEPTINFSFSHEEVFLHSPGIGCIEGDAFDTWGMKAKLDTGMGRFYPKFPTDLKKFFPPTEN
jgi:hypothetical protein